MNQAMRFRLGEVIKYHQGVAAQAGARIEQREEDSDRNAEDQALIELHSDVAKQLQDVLDANPVVSGIDAARAAPDRVRRSNRLFPRGPRDGGRQFVSQGMLH